MAKKCAASGELFSGQVKKYRCDYSGNFYVEKYVTRFVTHEGRPVTYSTSYFDKIRQAETAISSASDPEEIARAIESAGDLPLDTRIVEKAKVLGKKLEAKRRLDSACAFQKLENLDQYFYRIRALQSAVEDAQSAGVDQIDEATLTISAIECQRGLSVALQENEETHGFLQELETQLSACKKFVHSPAIDPDFIHAVEAKILFILSTRSASEWLEKHQVVLTIESVSLKNPPFEFLHNSDGIRSFMAEAEILMETWKYGSEKILADCRVVLEKFRVLLAEREKLEADALEKKANKKHGPKDAKIKK